jgi:small subunit ribosomal protein S6
MTDYEVTYILRPSLEEADVEARAATFNEVVTSRGGELTHGEKLGKKRLAYEIADVREGYYVVMGFKSDAATAKELERQLKLQEDVLRALLVQLDKKALAAMAAPPVQLAPVETDY